MTLNFVRNRQVIHRHLLHLKHCVIAHNFTLKRSTADWRSKVLGSTSRHHHQVPANRPTLSPTENGSIAELRRVRRIKTSSTISAVPNGYHIGDRPKLQQRDTLSMTAITPQTSVLHVSVLSNEALPTVRERGDGIMNPIHEPSGSFEEESDIDLTDDVPEEDDGSAVEELVDTDCIGTPSSRASKASEVDGILSPQIASRPTISITVPMHTEDMMVECPLEQCQTTKCTNAPRPQSASSRTNGTILPHQRTAIHVTASSVSTEVSFDNDVVDRDECAVDECDHDSNSVFPQRGTLCNLQYISHRIGSIGDVSPLSDRHMIHSSHRLTINRMRPSISAPPPTDDGHIAPNKASHHRGDVEKEMHLDHEEEEEREEGDEDEIEFYSTASSHFEESPPFRVPTTSTKPVPIEDGRSFFKGKCSPMISSTPSRKRKALEVLGIGSNESGARTPSPFARSLPNQFSRCS